MVKHRYYLPALIVLISLLDLIPTVINKFGVHGIVQPTPMIVQGPIQGLPIGITLFILCARWIKKSQSDGVVYLGWGSEFIVILYFIIRGVASWFADMRMSWICSLLVASEPIQCAIAFSAFWLALELGFLGGVYIWGLIYERKIGRLLMYRMTFLEKRVGRTGGTRK